MRLGIFADIHANLEALKASVAAYQDLSIDKYVCLGDVVGYGASPCECCDIVRDLASTVVCGNHDAAVTNRMDYFYYYNAARHALKWTASQLRRDQLAWLSGLPYVAKIDNFCFSHGSPVNPEDFNYIFNVEQASELLNKGDDLADVNFIGHSHLTKVFSFKTGEVNEVIARRFRLRKARKYVLTTGSIGQPRDYDARACFTVFDTETLVFEYHRVDYDVETAAHKIYKAGLAINFGRRLFLGV